MLKTFVADTGETVFALSGRLDTTTSPILEKTLLETLGEKKNIILDFADIAYVSSAGLRTLLVAQKQAQINSVTMSLRAVTPVVMKVFEMTGFNSLLTFC